MRSICIYICHVFINPGSFEVFTIPLISLCCACSLANEMSGEEKPIYVHTTKYYKVLQWNKWDS